MAHGVSSSKALATANSSRPPSLEASGPRNGRISLRPVKEFARRLSQDHPLRVVLAGEPDEMDAGEYCVKLTVWLRLLPTDAR